MREFFWALAIIFQVEGGWTELDGGTNFGITAATLRRANDLQIVRTRNVRYLTRREAARIYYKMFWLTSGANRHPHPLNLVVFDGAVHMGPGVAKQILQTAIQNAPSSHPPVLVTCPRDLSSCNGETGKRGNGGAALRGST